MLEQAGAAMRVEADRAQGVQAMRRARAYEPLFDALVELGIDRSELEYGQPGLLGIGRMEGGAYNFDQIWRLARERGVEGLPATQQAFEQDAYRRGGERTADQDTLARGTGAGSVVASFAGGMAGSFADEVNVYTLPIGGGGRTAAMRILSEGLVNAGVEGAQALGPNPQAYANMGEEYGATEAVQDIALAGAGGMAFRGAIELAPAGGRAIARIDAAGVNQLAPVRQRFDNFFRDRDMARVLARGELPPGITPEQEAALRVLTREAEIDEASPNPRTIEGDEAHRNNLERAGRDNAAGRPGRDFGQPNFAAVKRAIAGPESNGNDRATNGMGSNASGRYQFIPETFRNLYMREYGATEAQANTAWERNRFNVVLQERLMDRLLADNAAALARGGQDATPGNLYLAHFAGADAAVKLLRGDPEAPVSSFFSRKAIEQNPTYLGTVKQPHTVAQALDIIRGKVGDAPGAAARPDAGAAFDEAATAADAELARIDTEQAEATRLRDAARRELTNLVRPLVRVPGTRLHPETLAADLGVDPMDVRRALSDMAAAGELELVISKKDRGRVPVARRARKAKSNVRDRFRWRTNDEILAENDGVWPGTFRNKGYGTSDDALAFIVREGGLVSAGRRMDEASGTGQTRDRPGHDLRNTGNLDMLVPGVGPLIRPGGKTLDQMAEALWEAGYFGPSNVVARPTESELISWIDEVVRKAQAGEKTYLPGEGPERADPLRDPDAIEEPFDRGAWEEEMIAAQEAQFQRDARVFLEELRQDNPALADGLMPAGLLQDALFAQQEALFDGRRISADMALFRATEARYARVAAQIDKELGDADYIPGWDDEVDARLEKSSDFDEDGWELDSSGSGSAADTGLADGSGAAGRGSNPDGAAEESLTPAARDAAADTRNGPAPDPEQHVIFDDPAGEGAKLATQSHWHDIDAPKQMEQAQSQQQIDYAREIARDLKIDKISIDTMGPLGPEIDGLTQRWPEIVKLLSALQNGDARAALWHPATQAIDVVWGNENAGLAHILKKHGGDIGNDFPDRLAEMRVTSKERNRILLGNDEFEAVVELAWQGQPKRWLLTAYRRSGTERSAAAPLADRAAQDPGQSAAGDIGAPRADGNAQADFAAPTPDQARIALERQAEGRQKGTVPQKAAGADGGLFDTQDTTLDMLGDLDLGDGRGVRPVADIRTEIETDRKALDALRGCME